MPSTDVMHDPNWLIANMGNRSPHDPIRLRMEAALKQLEVENQGNLQERQFGETLNARTAAQGENANLRRDTMENATADRAQRAKDTETYRQMQQQQQQNESLLTAARTTTDPAESAALMDEWKKRNNIQPTTPPAGGAGTGAGAAGVHPALANYVAKQGGQQAATPVATGTQPQSVVGPNPSDYERQFGVTPAVGGGPSGPVDRATGVGSGAASPAGLHEFQSGHSTVNAEGARTTQLPSGGIAVTQDKNPPVFAPSKLAAGGADWTTGAGHVGQAPQTQPQASATPTPFVGSPETVEKPLPGSVLSRAFGGGEAAPTSTPFAPSNLVAGGPQPNPTPGVPPTGGPFSGSIGNITQGQFPPPAAPTPTIIPKPSTLSEEEKRRQLAASTQ